MVWYEKIHKFFLANGFTLCHLDSNLYVKRVNEKVLVLYIDDLILTGSDGNIIVDMEKKL